MSTTELQRIRDVYSARIEAGVVERYSLLRAGELYIAQDRERTLLRLLGRCGLVELRDIQVLEVGCGRADRLLDWLRWGATAHNLTGVDLMEPLLGSARGKLPSAHFTTASVDKLPFREAAFDLVAQFTLFSSILDKDMRHAAANEMWRVLRPGGVVLWYDLRYPSPYNRDVRPLGKREIVRLFPGAGMHIRSTTLAPPLARGLAPLSWLACEIISMLPVMRTHYTAILQKPAA
jgi:ubiquinone/menaquinone biosynthesis C-methylase UbiE